MTQFDRLHMTFYQCSVVTAALSCTFFEMFNFKICDLETRVRGHSRKVIETGVIRYPAYDFLLVILISKLVVSN